MDAAADQRRDRAGVPSAVFFCAWQASESLQDPEPAWISAGIVGTAAVISGSILVARYYLRHDESVQDTRGLDGKSRIDADTFDVVEQPRLRLVLSLPVSSSPTLPESPEERLDRIWNRAETIVSEWNTADQGRGRLSSARRLCGPLALVPPAALPGPVKIRDEAAGAWRTFRGLGLVSSKKTK